MSPDVTTIPLNGDLTVRQAGQIQAVIAEALGKTRHVVLDCTAAERVDLSFLQLVLAGRASARAAGGDLTLAVPSDAVTMAACRAGLAGAHALTSPDEHGFWHVSPTGVP